MQTECSSVSLAQGQEIISSVFLSQTGRAQRPLADEESTIWTGRHVQLSAKRMKWGKALTCHTVSAPGNP